MSAPSGSAARKIAAVEAEIAGEKQFEWAVAFDERGTEVFRKRGDPRAVTFTPEETTSFKDRFLTHNHRSGRGFSEGDVAYAVDADVRQLRVTGITRDGQRHTHTLTRPKDGWGVTSEQVRGIYADIETAVAREFVRRMRRGEITRAEADTEHAHQVAQRVARLLGWAYRRRRLE